MTPENPEKQKELKSILKFASMWALLFFVFVVIFCFADEFRWDGRIVFGISLFPLISVLKLVARVRRFNQKWGVEDGQ